MSGRPRDVRPSRRELSLGLVTLALPLTLPACGPPKQPETPLAHLYGKEWISGAYGYFSKSLVSVGEAAGATTTGAYKVLAQKGVVALDGLQSREVPFYVRANPDSKSFTVERNVPERLTFRANMTDAERRAAEDGWKRATEHLHTDYDEIRRLNGALTTMFTQIAHVRSAVEQGAMEQFNVVEQLADLDRDPKALPFQLPFQVNAGDYKDVLLLLLERMDDDRKRLETLEAQIVAVGLTARATDAGSASLAANVKKVLVAVAQDGTTRFRPLEFPKSDAERAKLLATAAEIRARILKSAEFAAYVVEKKRRRDAERDSAIGGYLSLIDAFTGLPASKVYKSVVGALRGEGDYMSYLATAASFVPGGSALGGTLQSALEYTQTARKVTSQALSLARSIGSPEELRARAEGVLSKQGADVVVNTGSRFAIERLDRQLSFFKDKADVASVDGLLAQTPFLSGVLPQSSSL